MGEHASESAGDALVAQILAGDETGLAMELWAEVSRGYPVERIAPLLKSDLESAVKEGIWLAAELRARSRTLLGDIAPLLSHASPSVRGYAVEAIAGAATIDDSEILARAAERITDAHTGVRAEAVRLLASQPEEQLASAQQQMRDSAIGSWVARLLRDVRTGDAASVRLRLGSKDRTERLFALATLMRIMQGRPETVLIDITDADTEVQRLARSYVRDSPRKHDVDPT